ncbi:MAG: DUF937 domain-containing protein [Nitratireductor sp.]|nr:DUF937 domain-containing protein [Nitratireductor sp.]
MQGQGLGQRRQASIPEQMAQQFGVQAEQAQKAIEALMPAFSEGLKRNMASPQGLMETLQALASGNHARYMQNPMEAFSAGGMQEGNAILGHLFGSKELSRAVAQQAEAASGLSQNILKQMLPALAPMIMGGLFQQMTGQNRQPQQQQHAASGLGGNIFGEILEQMMRNGMPGGNSGGGRQQAPRGGNPFEDFLKQMTGGGRSGGSTTRGKDASETLGEVFQDMLRGGLKGGYRQDEPEPAPDPYARAPRDPYEEPRRKDPYSDDAPETGRHGYPRGTGLDDLFGDLFKPPSGTAPKYEKDIESIFDQFLGKR